MYVYVGLLLKFLPDDAIASNFLVSFVVSSSSRCRLRNGVSNRRESVAPAPSDVVRHSVREW